MDLGVFVIDDGGERWNLRPTGDWTQADVDARTDLLVYDTGPRTIDLLTGSLPSEVRAVELRARLHHPGMQAESPLAAVGEPVRIEL